MGTVEFFSNKCLILTIYSILFMKQKCSRNIESTISNDQLSMKNLENTVVNRTNPFSTQDYIYRSFNEFIIYTLYRSQHIYQYSVGVTEMVILTFHFLIINWYKHQPLYLVLDTVFKYRKVSLMT